MAIRPIYIYPSPVLKEKSQIILPERPGELQRVQRLVLDMVETMHASDGVGLSAVQIGVLERVVVTLDGVYINPQIVSKEGEQEELNEGCLSFPGIFERVKRYPRVTVKALDANFREFTANKDGLIAQCLQHEVEHLDGMLLSDKMKPDRREAVGQQMLKVGKRA